MTWLTPLFLVAGIAVIGPILFHMWQRTPRGRRLFSSTMFLAASPPRITHRSRIENWPLLLLRALALILLAVGFARPVWRTEAQSPTILSSDKTVAILVDVSASLQRTALWDSLVEQVSKRIDQLPTTTHIGLFAFDHDWQTSVSFEEADRLDCSVRRQLIRERLATLKPGWGSTHLGGGLARTMQALREYESSRPVREATEIWLASDLTAGADLTGLAGIDWPESTRLEIITPDVAAGTNAGLQWVESRSEAQGKELRVRITNAKLSTTDRFQIGWDDAFTESARVDVHVPAGQSRTILAPPRPQNLSESVPLRLFGDDHEFDNRLWSAENRRRAIWILYLGTDDADDPSGPRFFLEQALAGASDADISVRTASDVEETAAAVADPPALAVWTDTNADPPGWLRDVLEKGGSLLAVPRTAEEARLMLAYQGMPATDVEEATVKDFSLLSDIDFEDPLFATFAQARFADFTGIHFWKHRRVQLPDKSPLQVLARFDDGDPFLMRQSLGDGRCWTLTSGWHPADSQLARSSIFPLLHRFLEQSTRLTTRSSRSDVGSEITWTMLRGDGTISVRRPDDSVEDQTTSEAAYRHTERPGIYVSTRNGESETWAINVAPAESKTDPLPVESLERLGVMTKRPVVEEAAIVSPVQQRQLQLEELERRQSWWRWCLLAAGFVLLVETAWAAKMSQVPNLNSPI